MVAAYLTRKAVGALSCRHQDKLDEKCLAVEPENGNQLRNTSQRKTAKVIERR